MPHSSVAPLGLGVKGTTEYVENGNLWNASAVLSDFAAPSNLDTSTFLTVKDNLMLNPIFEMLSSRAIQHIPDMLGYL